MSDEQLFLVIWGVAMLVTWPPWIWWSIRSRQAHGYPIIPRMLSASVYSERRASGRQQGKLAGASNCLLISVTKDTFLVAPAFPFNLVAPRGMFGLEHTLPRDRIVASTQTTWLGANVRVELGPEADHAILDLKVRDPAAFVKAVGAKP